MEVGDIEYVSERDLFRRHRGWSILEAAIDAREESDPHISGYKVGAAIRTNVGIFLGCNMETDIHTGCLHAEVHATANALFAGAGKAYDLCVLVHGPPFFPCGMCRQILYEKWGGDLRVMAYGDYGYMRRYKMHSKGVKTIGELLPDGFKKGGGK